MLELTILLIFPIVLRCGAHFGDRTSFWSFGLAIKSPMSILRVASAAVCILFVACVVIATRRESQVVELEERKSDYLGDQHALNTADARTEADKFFDKRIKHDRVYHSSAKSLKKKGMSARAARSDLNSFFDTLGLTKSHQKEAEHVKKSHHKTTVNIYINEKGDKKKMVKVLAAKKQAELKKEHQAKKVASKPMSKFDREMKEAKQLLKQSKMERALAQARTVALKAEAPYYTS